MNLFPSINSSGGFAQGELLTIDSTGGFVKANSSLNMPIIGVAKPIDVWGASTTKPAILGIFTLKVSNANGAIKTGDRLAMSSVDGVAVKAASGGDVVGYALEDFDSGSPANIKVFVSPQWYNGTTTPSTIVLSGEVHATGFVNSSTREVKENIAYLNENDYDEALEKIVGAKVAEYDYKSDANDANCHANDSNNSNEFVDLNRCGAKRLGLIAEEAPKEVLSANGKGVDLYKMVSFAWAGMKAQQGQIDKIKMDIEELRSLTSNFQLPISTSGGDGSPNLFGSILNSFRAIGAVFENNWFKAKNVAAEMLHIRKNAVPEENSIGEAAIPQGQIFIIVQNKFVKSTSQIFLTPKTPLAQSLAITEIKEGESFKVELAQAENKDVRFAWLIIGTLEPELDSGNSNDPSSAEASEGRQIQMSNQIQSSNDQASITNEHPGVEEILPSPPLQKEGETETLPVEQPADTASTSISVE
jgi:hypothetical protein